jgi:chromosome segregation ATPase
MTDDIKKIKDLVEIIVNKIRSIETHQNVMAEQVRTIKDQQSVMNDKLDNHTASLMNIEATLEGYSDMYKVNKEKNEELEERVDLIEDQLGVSKNN